MFFCIFKQGFSVQLNNYAIPLRGALNQLQHKVSVTCSSKGAQDLLDSAEYRSCCANNPQHRII